MTPIGHKIFRTLPALLLIVGALTQHACREAPALHPLSDAAVILAFGDSLTFGTGTGPQNSYPARLEKITGKTVVNAGVPGEISAEGLERLGRELKRSAPDLVILCHGGNDFLRRMPRAQTEANLQAMIGLIEKSGAQVLLVAVPAPGFMLRAPSFYRSLAESAQIPIAENVLAEILTERSLKSDQIHPNADGYEKLARRLAEILSEQGALLSD